MNVRQQNFYCQPLQSLYNAVHQPETVTPKGKKEMFQCALDELGHHLKKLYTLTMEHPDGAVEVVSRGDQPFSGPCRKVIQIKEIAEMTKSQIDFIKKWYPGEGWYYYGSAMYHQERAIMIVQIFGGWQNDYSVLEDTIPGWWKGMENIAVVQCEFTSHIRFLINGTIGLTVPPMNNFTKSALGV